MSPIGPVPTLGEEGNRLPQLFSEVGSIFECPVTGEPLNFSGNAFVTLRTGRRYLVDNGIPNFFVSTGADESLEDVTQIVKEFYEETPFPNYDRLDSRASLMEKARKGVFAAMLYDQLPADSLVLEAGCGTGQLTNFLGMSWKCKVFGGDICLNSLRLAQGFRDRFSINNAAFLQMNLFRPPFQNQCFDLIVANGVLHHTSDPQGGFKSLLSKLKVGGIIIVGLYNSYARVLTLMRRRLFERFGTSLYFLDPRLQSSDRSSDQVKAWFMDQYRHPHESKHSYDEVLRWFDTNGVEFLTGIPHPNGQDFTGHERLFDRHPRGTRLDRMMTQLGMLLNGGKDGGLFVMIGRKQSLR